MTAMLSFEAVIDRKAEALCCRFKEFAATGQSFDVRCWMQFFAFDVIGEISVCVSQILHFHSTLDNDRD